MPSSRRICGTQGITHLYSVQIGGKAPLGGQIQVSLKLNVHENLSNPRLFDSASLTLYILHFKSGRRLLKQKPDLRVSKNRLLGSFLAGCASGVEAPLQSYKGRGSISRSL